MLGSCRVCDEPSSEDPHEWPDDITKWPVSWGGGFGSRPRVGRGIHPSPISEAGVVPTVGPPGFPGAMFWPLASLFLHQHLPLSRSSEQNQVGTWEVK